ncbi:MAG: hypothetical protein ACTSW1_02040 [Candidatus Hodarchaeales archaeon]
MRYQINLDDIETAFEYSSKYFLEKGTTTNRTTGQYRGLGAVLDDNVIGKVTEMGVASILNSQDKMCVIDLGIHTITDENRTDPDIIKIRENGQERDPAVFVEIKLISSNDRWLGLTLEQYDTIKQNSLIHGDLSNIFLIYATVDCNNADSKVDLLGTYLKNKIGGELFEEYPDEGELFIKIRHILTGKELEENGTHFLKDSYLYETNLFTKAGRNDSRYAKNYEQYSRFTKYETDSDILPIVMNNNNPPPTEIGDFYIEGNYTLVHKQNDKSERLFILPESEVTIRNEVLGKYQLQPNLVYFAHLTTCGRDPVLKRNNIWVPLRNLHNITEKTVNQRIEEIKELI